MSKQKIYLVCQISGENFDYHFLKAFFDKNKAIEFKAKQESLIKKLEARYCNKCCNCAYGEKYCELYKKPKENSNNDCENRVESYDVFDVYYTIKEIEVE